jgi:hypothetical protein
MSAHVSTCTTVRITDYVYHTSLEHLYSCSTFMLGHRLCVERETEFFFYNAVINILLIASFKMATACYVPFSIPFIVSEI